MNLISFNLLNYLQPEYLKTLNDVVIRINLAWHPTAQQLYQDVKYAKDLGFKIFVGIPTGRTKPPTSQIEYEHLEMLNLQFGIDYLAVSNVSDIKHIEPYMDLVKLEQIVPKIENKAGIDNFRKIFNDCSEAIQYVMLDHGDLFLDLKENGHTYIIILIPFWPYAKN